MSVLVKDIVKQLTSTTKLDRDNGLTKLNEFLKNATSQDVYEIERNLLQCFVDERRWEVILGGLLGSKLVAENQSNIPSNGFLESLENYVSIELENVEFRVRIAAGDVLGAICKLKGITIYHNHKQKILDGISTNLERNLDLEDNVSTGTHSLSATRNASQIFHDTAGWKSLETWMKCLQFVIDGCEHLFNPCIDQPLLDLLFAALLHTNRFVRETGYYVCASLVASGVNKNQSTVIDIDNNAIYHNGAQFSSHLANGLSDNWSMVRLAASVTARKFFLSLPSESNKDSFYRILLPRMCLNRYYVAEGVRIYSQESWVLICKDRGIQMVEQYIQPFVEHYIEQTKADNHAVREATCACIAELGKKITRAILEPYISQLMEALLICFQDDSWPVRDSACVACGNFIKCFPEETRSNMVLLYPLFFANLQDPIASVRQGAAHALANVIRAYGQECVAIVMEKVRAGLSGVNIQPIESERYGGVAPGPGTYGVVKRLRDNDMDLHSERQMFSCGSLAPKLGRGTNSAGCMDEKFHKPSEPWELADGCIHLVAELSNSPELHDQIIELIPAVISSVSYRHYTCHVVLLYTLCTRIIDIAKGLTKIKFKTHLEMFLEPIFYSLSCENELTSNAASQCLRDLSAFIGPGILRGRIELHNPTFLSQFDHCTPSVR